MFAAFEIPFPPSMNTYWRNFRGRMVLSAKGREYSIEVEKIVCVRGDKGFPIKGRLCIEIYLHRGDRRSYDIDNCLKAVCDSMTKAGVWEDDSQIDEIVVRRKALLKPGRAYILINKV